MLPNFLPRARRDWSSREVYSLPWTKPGSTAPTSATIMTSWIPTSNGPQRPRDCRDTNFSVLCDRVTPILDMQTPTALQSQYLRRMLGWDEPVPMDVITAQYRQILKPSQPQSSPRSEYLDGLTSQLGSRR